MADLENLDFQNTTSAESIIENPVENTEVASEETEEGAIEEPIEASGEILAEEPSVEE